MTGNCDQLGKFIKKTGVLLAGFLFASQVNAGQVGTTTGSFEVTAGGQSSYSMGIEVPPGIMGVVPQVAISYSSGGGNGLLGLGSSLSGLSSITRCGKTIVKDNVAAAVQYTNDDFFCLNGQRLILMSGSYGANNATYQTELESFQKVTSKGSLNGGPEYFEVLAKGGSKLVFGKSLSGTHLERAIDPITQTASAWGVSYVEDKYGNRVVYEYEDASRTQNGVLANQILPKRITYGHNVNAGVTGKLAVEFVYETRPDSATGYARGQQFISDVRISNIMTKVDTDTVKDYRVTYEQSAISNQSRITQITECSGEGNCLLPVTFTWSDYQNDWASGSNLPFAALTSAGGMRGVAIDVNNDGHTDWVTAIRDASGNDVLQTYLNDNGSWSTASGYTPPAPLFDYQRQADGVSVSELVDLNGDGKVDWVQAYTDSNGTTNKAYINNGANWVYDSTQSLPTVLADLNDNNLPKQRAEFIDLNGDALPDLVSSYRNSSGVTVNNVWLNTGSGWQSNTDFRTPVVLIDYSQYDKGAATGFFLDINNDGLSDVVQSYKSNTGVTHKATWLNTGTGWQPSTAHQLPTILADYSGSYPEALASPVDINGDGLIDIVQAHQKSDGSQLKKVWLNKDNGWSVDNDLAPPSIAWMRVGDTLQTTGLFVDVSNDGLPDFVQSYTSSSSSANKVWRNLGDGWEQDNSLAMPIYLTQLNSGSDSHTKAILFDVNSDGRGDLISSAGGSSSSVSLNGTNGASYALPEVVTHFSDGLGNAHKVEYSPATKNGVYTPHSDGAYPVLDVAGPMLLVSAVESAVGTTTTSRAEHEYFGKKVHVTGYGDLGFAKKKVTDTRTNVHIETEFSQQWPYIGSPLITQKRTALGVLLMETSNNYATYSLFGGKTFMVYPSEKSGTNYEINGQEINTSTSVIDALDAYGNVLSTTTTNVYQGGNAPSSYQTIKIATYANDATNWQIGQVLTSTTTNSAPGTPSISNKTAFTYYADSSLKTKIIEPDSAQAVTESYVYDDFGHITTTTISAAGLPSRVTTATYTADGRFAATATNPLGHTASSEYHPFFGQVTRTVGPNGSVTKKLYDDHGRMIKTTKIRTTEDAEAAADQANNVVVFHPCSDANPCPSNAAYFLGVVDNEGEAPETVYYDNRNREVRKQTQGFDGTSVYVDTTYDEYGRKFKVTKPYYKDAATIYETTYYYDLLGRVNKVVTPAGKEIRTDYYVGRTVVTNPLGQTKTTYVNGQGKPIQVVDHQGNQLNYTYDAAGRLLTTITGSDASTQIRIEYDHFGRKTKQNDPDLGEWQYAYDAFGQLVWQQDAKGQVVTMEYDILGRITKRTEAEGVTQWEYDTGVYSLGKLNRVWNDQGYERTHTYDQYGRATEVTSTIDGDSTTIKTDYHHTTDRVQYVEYPSGLKIRKEFNDYGFPLSIRSSSQDYLERYEQAEAEAQTLANDANTYKDNTASAREGFLTTYNEEKGKAEALEEQITAGQRLYHSKLPGYNVIVNRQKESIELAKKHERFANVFRVNGMREQRQSVIYAYAAEYTIAKAEKKPKDWSEFEHLYDTILFPGGEAGLIQLKGILTFVLGVSEDQLPTVYRYVKAEDLALTAQMFAGRAQGHGTNAKKILHKANFHAELVQKHVDAAEGHANQANAYYTKVLKPIVDVIDGWVTEANAHYQNANEAAEEIQTIDTTLKAKVDAAVNAQRQAQALLNYYQNEGSELHWLAEAADAEGKVTQFTQGKHVTTNVSYDQSTGRLHGVLSQSTPEPIELEDGQSIPNTTERLSEFIGDVQATQLEAAGFAATSFDQMTQTQQQIDALDPNDPKLSPALQLAVQAQIDVLEVNKAIFEVDYNLNTDIGELTTNTLTGVQSLVHQLEEINAASQTDALQATNNVLVYNARVHALIAGYHSQLKGLYEYASHQQTQKATEITDINTVSPEFLQEYSDLGAYHTSLAAQHQARADAVVIDDGSENASPGLYGLAKATFRHKRLIDRHADISNKRRRINVALFAPLQHLNEASRDKYEDMGATDQANHFASNKLLGRSDRERFKQLERLYRDRLAVLEITHSEDDDIFANDTERKALYQHLADINNELGTMYANMSDQSYWDGTFDSFAQSLDDKSGAYNRLASNHHQIAANNQLLASRSSEQYDHSILGNDGTILSDSYTWDDIGNLIQRAHGAVNLIEDFEYDELNRLIRSDISGGAASVYELTGNDIVTYEYDALGNITYKSDIGSYDYGNGAGPHAVTAIIGDAYLGQKDTTYDYDANGNMISGDGRFVQYTSFNKPSVVQGDGDTGEFTYGPERQLIKQVEQNGTVPKTTIYVGNQYQKIYDGYNTTEKYHLSTHNGATIAVIIDNHSQPAPKTHYLHRDHLDSIVAITNEQGYIVERFFYDAFGKQLTAVNPNGTPLYGNTLDTDLTDRGFTGHKMIQAGLIHMGGRVYDPEIGRFLSADPHIQFAGNLQNYNRYSYVNNNPLSFNDPSGYFISKLFKALKKLFKKILKLIKKVLKAVAKIVKKVVEFIKKYYKVIIAVVVAIAVPVAAGFMLGGATSVAGALSWVATSATLGQVAAIGAIAGGLSSLVTTGSLTAAFKGAFFGAITAGVAYGFRAGNALANAFGKAAKVAKVAAHGIIGGARAKLDGMSFSKGFLSAAVAKALTPATNFLKENPFVQGLAVATIGGLTSKLAGGSFEQGFVAAGLAFAVNYLVTEWAKEDGTHYYKYRNKVCSTEQKSCTMKNVYDSATKNRAPKQVSSNVDTTYDDENYSFTNHTKEDHFLRNGTVTRTVVQYGDGIYMETVGEGQNIPLNILGIDLLSAGEMAHINNYVGGWFESADSYISLDIWKMDNNPYPTR